VAAHGGAVRSFLIEYHFQQMRQLCPIDGVHRRHIFIIDPPTDVRACRCPAGIGSKPEMLRSWPKRFLNDVIGIFVAHTLQRKPMPCSGWLT
jgi:hypothetical protein